MGIEPGSIVLDVGFGSAEELITASRIVGTQGTVYGIEPNEGVVSDALERLKDAPNIRVMIGDAIRVPLLDDSVSFLIFKGVLHEVDRVAKALSEAKRVCRNNGRVAVIDFSAFPRGWLRRSNLGWRLRNPSRILASSLDRHPGFSRETITNYLEEAGLRLLRYEADFALGRFSGHAVSLFLAMAEKGV